MTRDDHPSGTDRVAEVAERHAEADVVVNVQGDQPFATPEMLSALVEPYVAGETPADDDARLSRSRTRRPGTTRTSSRSCATAGGYALYFSRSSIPHARRGRAGRRRCTTSACTPSRARPCCGSRRSSRLRSSGSERLEQLRALEHGISIRVCAHRPPRARGEHTRGPRCGRSELAGGAPVTAVRITDDVSAGRRPAPARARRAVRRRGTGLHAPDGRDDQGHLRAPRHGLRLQVVVRQGQPLVGRVGAGARPGGGARDPRRRQGASSASRSSPTSTRAAGRAGGGSGGRPPDPRLPEPPDGPPASGRRVPVGR